MFQSQRYFAIYSFVAIAAVCVVMVMIFQMAATEMLVRQGEDKNQAITKALANSLDLGLGDFIKASGQMPTDALRGHPLTALLDFEVRRGMRTLDMAKVKIYDLNRRTVFSTEAKQIGADNQNYEGVKTALAGGVHSVLTYRDSFHGMDGALTDRHLLSSYIPLMDNNDKIYAVLEIYGDASPLVERMRQQRWYVAGVSGLLLGVLYLFLVTIVHRSNAKIGRQQAEILANDQRLRAKAEDLEREIAQRQQIETDLRLAKDSAEEANRGKSRFLANMSHELRTPLNAIIGFSEIISAETFGPIGQPKYREYSGDILSSGRHLLALINDLLDLAKIDAGRVELRDEILRLDAVAADAMRVVHHLAESGGLALASTVSPSLPPVRADSQALHQVFINLLSNAIKFTKPGGKVTISARSLANHGMAISVTDTGIGIPPEHLAKVASAYHQVDSEIARDKKGTGLGLALSKSLIELHDGQLDIDSTVGVGTTVRVTLPRERVLSGDKAAATGQTVRKLG